MNDLRRKLSRNRNNKEDDSHRPHWNRSLDQVEFTVDTNSRFEFVEELEEEDRYFAQNTKVNDLREKLHTSHSKIPQNFGNFEVQNDRRYKNQRRERNNRGGVNRRQYENQEDLRRHLDQRQLQNYENYEPAAYRDEYMPFEHMRDEEYLSRDHIDERYLQDDGGRYESRSFGDVDYYEQDRFFNYRQEDDLIDQQDRYEYDEHPRQQPIDHHPSYERNNCYPEERGQYRVRQENTNRHGQERLYDEPFPGDDYDNGYENNPPPQERYARENFIQRGVQGPYQEQDDVYENNPPPDERYLREDCIQRGFENYPERNRYEERQENYQQFPQRPYEQESYDGFHETEQRPFVEPEQQPQKNGQFGLNLGFVQPAGPSSEYRSKDPMVLSGADPFAPNTEPQPMEIDIAQLPNPSGRSSNLPKNVPKIARESKKKSERRGKNTKNSSHNKFKEIMKYKNVQELYDVRDEHNHKKRGLQRSLSPQTKSLTTRRSLSPIQNRSNEKRRNSPFSRERRRSRSRSRDRNLQRSLSPQQRPSRRFPSPSQLQDHESLQKQVDQLQDVNNKLRFEMEKVLKENLQIKNAHEERNKQTLYDMPAGPSRGPDYANETDADLQASQLERRRPSRRRSRSRSRSIGDKNDFDIIPLNIPKTLNTVSLRNIDNEDQPKGNRNNSEKKNGIKTDDSYEVKNEIIDLGKNFAMFIINHSVEIARICSFFQKLYEINILIITTLLLN